MALDTQIGTQSASGINITENALYSLEKRYLKKNGQGKVPETPE